MNRVVLNTQQTADLIRALQVIDNLQQQLDDLEACGENCQIRRVKAANTRKNIQELISRFGTQT